MASFCYRLWQILSILYVTLFGIFVTLCNIFIYLFVTKPIYLYAFN